MPDYSIGDVARILKVSPRRLRYWQKTRLVRSSQANSEAEDAVDLDLRAPLLSQERALIEAQPLNPAQPLESLAEPGAALPGPGVGGEGADVEDPPERFGFRDLVVLRAIVSLVDKGIPLQRIRRNLETLRERAPEMDDPAAALRLLDEDSRRIVVRNDGRLEEATGQLLLEFDEGGSPASGVAASVVDFEAEAEAARSALSADLELPDEDALVWFERGCELDAESERFAEAIEAYETALEIEPDYADAYCNLGAVRYNQGQRAEAKRAFEACLAREADHVEANFNLANVLEEEGDDRAALSHYRRALAADPFYPDLHINLALLYEKLDRTKPACDHWRRYLQLDPTGTWSEVARLRLDRESDQA